MKAINRIFLFLVAAVIAGAVLFAAVTRLFPLKYTDLIDKYSKQFGTQPQLISAVILAESGYRESVVSQRAAVGLMQLTEPTLFWLFSKTSEKEDFGAERLVEPEVCIKYGTLNLSLLLTKYKDEGAALAAYNAGQSKVDKWLADSRYSADGKTLTAIPYGETDTFVKRVQFNKSVYNFLYQIN